MYLWWYGRPVTNFDKMSVIFRVIQETPDNAKLIYWGNQQTFYDVYGTGRAGCHFGFQKSNNGSKLFNWGGYDNGQNEIQTISITGAPTGGTFTLTFGGQTTSALAYNASAATIQSALSALSSIGNSGNPAQSNVTCTGGPLPATAVSAEFVLALSDTDHPMMTSSSSLSGGSSPAIVITETRKGEPDGTCRGSFPTLAYDPAVPVSPYYDWRSGEDYLIEMFKSPKQNYVAAELTTDGSRSGDQAPDEIAWRCTATRLSTNEKTIIRDLLVPHCKTTPGAIFDPVVWSEDFNIDSAPTATEQYHVRWTEFRVDDRLVPWSSVHYGSNTLTNTDVFLDEVGYNMKAVTARSTTTDEVLYHPGPVLRSATRESLGNKTASATMAIDKPLDAAVGEQLLAILATDSGSTPQTPSSWKLLGSVVNASGPSLTFLAGKATAASSYTFTNSASSNIFAGILMCYYAADSVTVALVGEAVSGTNTNAWNAPVLEKPVNYGRVGVVTAVRPAGAGATTNFNPDGSLIKRADTFDVTGNWITVALAEEAAPTIIGQASAKTGTSGYGNNLGVQYLVYPELQWLRPNADVAAGSWTAAPLWEKIDEAVASDADFIAGPPEATATVGLGGTVLDPMTGKGHVLHYRYRRQNASGGASLLVELLQTDTLIASRTEIVPAGNALMDGTLSLTEAEADAITDYSALRIRLTAVVN
jgi:hypothetical protein